MYNCIHIPIVALTILHPLIAPVSVVVIVSEEYVIVVVVMLIFTL